MEITITLGENGIDVARFAGAPLESPQAKKSGLLVARALAGCAQAAPQPITSDSHTYGYDLPRKLYSFRREAKAHPERQTWARGLPWDALIETAKDRTGGYKASLIPDAHIVVKDYKGSPITDDLELRRFITGGAIEHLAKGYKSLKAEVAKLRKGFGSPPSTSFWPWLAGGALETVAKEIRHEPVEPPSGAPTQGD